VKPETQTGGRFEGKNRKITREANDSEQNRKVGQEKINSSLSLPEGFSVSSPTTFCL
jgi:hypothetical protein